MRYPHLRSTRFNRHTQLPEHVPRADTSPYAPPVPVLTCEPHHESNTYHGAIEANTTIPPPPPPGHHVRPRPRAPPPRSARAVRVRVRARRLVPASSLSLSLPPQLQPRTTHDCDPKAAATLQICMHASRGVPSASGPGRPASRSRRVHWILRLRISSSTLADSPPLSPRACGRPGDGARERRARCTPPVTAGAT